VVVVTGTQVSLAVAVCREYLTGFHKRKQERRRFGLDMEAFKVKKRQLEAKKQVIGRRRSSWTSAG
jgi:hypothetical protein